MLMLAYLKVATHFSLRSTLTSFGKKQNVRAPTRAGVDFCASDLPGSGVPQRNPGHFAAARRRFAFELCGKLDRPRSGLLERDGFWAASRRKIGVEGARPAGWPSTHPHTAFAK